MAVEDLYPGPEDLHRPAVHQLRLAEPEVGMVANQTLGLGPSHRSVQDLLDEAGCRLVIGQP